MSRIFLNKLTGRMAPRLVTLALMGIFSLSSAGCAPLKALVYDGFVGRDDWQQPDKVIEALHIEPGQDIADLGSGGGYFTFKLAKATGPQGKVYAVDVDSGMLERLAGLASEQGAENVEMVQATYDDASLGDRKVDLVFTSNTYHHLEDRVAYFKGLRKYIKEGGRLAVIDLREDDWVLKTSGHTTASEVIRAELEEAGYSLVKEHEFIERQHFLVFSR